MTSELLIERPYAERSPRSSRVTARVNGVDVWFESPDVALRASPEAFGSAFLLPAVSTRRRLAIGGAVGADWAGNIEGALETARRWWRFPKLLPRLDTRPVALAQHLARSRALCFSGGVDSFFTLLYSGWTADHLVFVHGFDVPLDDTHRADRIRAELEQVADAVGAHPITVRTNLRQHPDFRRLHWEQSHGGALAAVGHVLTGVIDGLLISSSYPRSDSHPWGSHWELDPHWSGSGLVVEHVGADFMRAAKLRLIAGSPLVRHHLRVCWENRDDRLNCSRCEKCVRTRVALCADGLLDAFPVLDGTDTLVADIDALPHLGRSRLIGRYLDALQAGLPHQVDQAVRRLLQRHRVHQWRHRLDELQRPARAIVRRLRPAFRRIGTPDLQA